MIVNIVVELNEKSVYSTHYNYSTTTYSNCFGYEYQILNRVMYRSSWERCKWQMTQRVAERHNMNITPPPPNGVCFLPYIHCTILVIWRDARCVGVLFKPTMAHPRVRWKAFESAFIALSAPVFTLNCRRQWVLYYRVRESKRDCQSRINIKRYAPPPSPLTLERGGRVRWATLRALVVVGHRKDLTIVLSLYSPLPSFSPALPATLLFSPPSCLRLIYLLLGNAVRHAWARNSESKREREREKARIREKGERAKLANPFSAPLEK